MLWSKRKITGSTPLESGAVESPGARVPASEQALDALGTLLKTYARFVFDTDRPAAELRQRCEEWAQRIVLGESRSSASALADSATKARDWHGLERFFTEVRERESVYVKQALPGLRRVVFDLARSLSGSAGEDQESDAQVEERLEGLSSALINGETTGISRAASAVIETSRAAMERRRERETSHVAKLGKQLRQLQEELTKDSAAAATDEATGLFTRTAYEQQLEQLTAIGMLLDPRPWLVVIEPELRGRNRVSQKRWSDDELREASKGVNRTFLRRQDFVARSGPSEFSVLLVDMTREQLERAVERLLAAARDLAPPSRTDKLTFAIGLAQLRPNEDAARWRARAELALSRAKQDGGDGHTIA